MNTPAPLAIGDRIRTFRCSDCPEDAPTFGTIAEMRRERGRLVPLIFVATVTSWRGRPTGRPSSHYHTMTSERALELREEA
ncbi:MAG TPA: hypothetical protein VLE97_00085 [Gaiellaceae bacterium]|nr:hypothetical protein [Gaiellaceae bacterium]